MLAYWSEIVSFWVIVSSDDYIGPVADFVALKVINDLNSVFFDSLYKTQIQKLISDGNIKIQKINLELKDLIEIEVSSSFDKKRD